MPPKVSKIEQELKKLTKIQENKTCCDCPEKMPAYADLTNSVFVCTKCAGIHRDFQFKVKGISMSVFTEEDVAYLASMGNGQFNAKYMAGYNSRDHPPPTGNDVVKLKEFIRAKYLDKRWYREEVGSIAPQPTSAPTNSNSLQRSGSHNSSTGGFGAGRSGSVTIKPLSSATKQSSFRQSSAPSGGVSTSNAGADLDLLSLDDPVPTATTQVHQPSTQSVDPFSSKPAPISGSSNGAGNFGVFDPFGSTPQQQQQQRSDPFGSTPQQQQQADPFSSGGFDAFSGDPKSAPANTGGFDAFSNPAPVNNQYQQQQFGGFSNFGGPNPQFQQSSMPIPFIKLAPPPPPEREPQPFDDQSDAQTCTAASERPPDPKNFSAFDELVPEIPQASSSNPRQDQNGTGAPTPFDGQHGVPAPYPPNGHYGGYPQHPPNLGMPGAPGGYPAGQPPNAYQGYPPAGTAHGHGGGYYGAQQGARYGAPQQGGPYGAPQQGGAYGAPPPGAPYGVSQHGQYPNHPTQQPYGSAPQHPHYTSPGLAPQTAPADPFAAMSGAAWNAVGSAPPADAPQSNASAGPSPSVPPTNAAAASVNPFDMF